MSNDLKDKLIGVLMGGISREREISLRSGRNVADALIKLGYQVKLIDIVSADCQEQLTHSGIEIAYNILHGNFGEDGQIQKILETLKIPYTGPGVRSSQLCIDKVACKKVLLKHNLPTAAYEEPQAGSQIAMQVPLVIKPKTEGSSFGVSIVQRQEQVAQIFDETKKEFGSEIFVEKFISGAEVTVGVMQQYKKLLALPILELVPKNEFYDFESKYTPGGTKFILPANLSPAVTELVQCLAVRAYQVLKCDGAVRVDFVIEARKTPYILEVNTIPGMTNQSDLPAEAKAEGISFEALVESILSTAGLNKH